jgi:Fe-S cluster assembly protein SufB
VIFVDMDSGLREHEDIVRQHFATVIPPNDNKLAALNSAVWSGGSFVYVPEGVHVEMPLQAYFRINTENMGQFERTLIIAEPGSYVHYVEGCTAPTYSSNSLHSAVVELIAKPGARIRYTTVQNWSTNVFNLVTKRAVAQEDATVEWVDCNLGSRLTMKYPSVYLMGERAHGEILSIAFAGKGQHQDAGGKIIHAAPNTTSNIFAAPTAACWRSPRAPTGLAPRWSATRCCSTSTRARTPIRRSGSARTTSTSATRRPSPRSARTSCST